MAVIGGPAFIAASNDPLTCVQSIAIMLSRLKYFARVCLATASV